MQYFQAVQQGKNRAGKSQMKLFDIAGFAMLTLTTKKVNGEFLPVGEEDYAAVIRTQDGYVTVLVDQDGFTKAQTKATSQEIALDVFKKLIDGGIPEYNKNEIQIWTERYPTIQNDLSL